MNDLFGFDDIQLGDEEKKYSKKVDAPTYTPREGRGSLLDCYDPQKFLRLCRMIEESNVTNDEKNFLKLAAARFIQFNYEAIADHYAIVGDETKALMEKLALVIIDFDKAIDEGFVQLNDKMRIIYEQERKNRA